MNTAAPNNASGTGPKQDDQRIAETVKLRCENKENQQNSKHKDSKKVFPSCLN
jgi:hypothetical protein